jgi:acetylornithine aminotransferase
MEPVQGESGVWPATAEYVQAVRAACDKAGALLIFDEVQTGFFRCGTHAFAYQHFGVSADIVTMAKGLGGGFPIGAFAAKAHIADVLGVGLHGTTFGGSALATAAANATIDVLLEEEIGANSEEVGAYLREELAKLDEVTEVRGKGLMVGASLKEGSPVAGDIVDAALPHGLIMNAIGTKIVRFLPPLVCTKKDIDKMLQCLKGAINDASK